MGLSDEREIERIADALMGIDMIFTESAVAKYARKAHATMKLIESEKQAQRDQEPSGVKDPFAGTIYDRSSEPWSPRIVTP